MNFTPLQPKDIRFRKPAFKGWEYTSMTGVVIPFEFALQAGAYAHVIIVERYTGRWSGVESMSSGNSGYESSCVGWAGGGRWLARI
jgi:hypothetical protein